MRILFNHCRLNLIDKYGEPYEDWGDVKLGVGWYRHSKHHKWFGFDLVFYLYFWRINFTFVSNIKEYDNKMNWRTYK